MKQETIDEALELIRTIKSQIMERKADAMNVQIKNLPDHVEYGPEFVKHYTKYEGIYRRQQIDGKHLLERDFLSLDPVIENLKKLESKMMYEIEDKHG